MSSSSGLKISSQLFNAEALLLATSGADGAGGGMGTQGAQGVQGGVSADVLGMNPVKLGSGSGVTNQSLNATAIGINAGNANQQGNAVAIGREAGKSNQGQNAIAIGAYAGTTNQPTNSIVLNAGGDPLEVPNEGLFIVPVRPPSQRENPSVPNQDCVMAYDKVTHEVRRTYVSTEMFTDAARRELNLPVRGPTGGQQTPSQQPYTMNNITYSYPFQRWNVVYNPNDLPGNAGVFTFTENISSQMTLDVMASQTLGLCDFASVWTIMAGIPESSLRKWESIAISTTGQYITVVSSTNSDEGLDGVVFTSSNRGQTWQLANFTRPTLKFVAMSGAGDIQCVVDTLGNAYVSTDFGSTWLETLVTSGGDTITSVATYPIAGSEGRFLFVTSTTSMYTYIADSQIWLNLFFDSFDPETGEPVIYLFAGSVAGMALPAGGYIGYVATNATTSGNPTQGVLTDKGIYVSMNNFTDNLLKTSAPALAWRLVACSANAKYLIASATDDANIWLSSNYGSTWTSYPIVNVVSATLTFNGQYQVVVQGDGIIFASEDYGKTWLPRNNVPPDNKPYRGVAMTASGQELYAVVDLEGLSMSTSRVCGSGGDRGFQGNQGMTGPSGGPTGDRGFQGPQGILGAQGSQGFTGLGFQGLMGATGVQGNQGSQGHQGAQGFTGLGFQGRAGLQGRQGPLGRQGATGRGFQGPEGRQGRQGRQGPIGRQGATGRGFQGVQGVPGQPGGAVINSNPVKIGYESGKTSQALNSTAVGIFAATSNQGARSVAIGWQSGMFNQGQNAIAIGPQAGYANQANHSIILNASSELLNAGTTGLFVAPIRFNSGFAVMGLEGLQGGQGVLGPQGLTGPAGGIGGSNTQIQFNDSGLFNGSPNMVFNSTTNVMTLGLANPTGFQVFGSLTQGLTGVAPSSTGGARLAVSNRGRYVGMETDVANTAIVNFKSLDGSASAYDGRISCTSGSAGLTGYGDMTFEGKNFLFRTTTTNDNPFVSIEPNLRYPAKSGLFNPMTIPRSFPIDQIVSSEIVDSTVGGGSPVTVTLPAATGYRLEILFSNVTGGAVAITYNGFFVGGTYSPASTTAIGSGLISVTLGSTGTGSNQPVLTFGNSNGPAPFNYSAKFMVLAWALK